MLGAIVGTFIGAALGVLMMCVVISGDEGECRNLLPYEGLFRCSECGCEFKTEDDEFDPEFWVDGAASYPNYCPNCGKRVRCGSWEA